MADPAPAAGPSPDPGATPESSPTPSATRRGPEESRAQGHWLLATLGKRVLRPGGIDLTRHLLAAAAPVAADRIVEFGPGVGRTAEMLLAAEPASYVGVDPNAQGRGALEKILDGHPQARLVVADAADSGLPAGQADLVVGEAMLSMHSPEGKSAIVAEAARLLAPGGRYAIHELLRTGEDPRGRPVGARDPVAADISRVIKVGARPLTVQGWTELIAAHGLQVVWIGQAPMHLLEPRRVVADEGVLGALRFAVNVLRNRAARKRVLAMRRSFRENSDKLAAIGIVAQRPLTVAPTRPS